MIFPKGRIISVFFHVPQARHGLCTSTIKAVDDHEPNFRFGKS